MIRRKSAVALAIMCALALSAVTAVGAASAAGTAEWFTCGEEPSGPLWGPHCLAAQNGSPVKYKHLPIVGTTKFTGTNGSTASGTTTAAASVLAGSISGVATELSCTTLSGSGEGSGSGTVVSGTGTITYTGCTVVKPSGKGCKVKEEKVTTNKLAAETEGPTELKFKPASGETFASITIESCSVGALNNTFPVTGSLIGTVTGSTTITTEPGITTQGKLFFGGNPAGLGGALTIKGPNGNGLSLT